MEKFFSSWWSVNLPSGWKLAEDKQAVELTSDRFPSAVHISAARNEAGPVTDEDEFPMDLEFEGLVAVVFPEGAYPIPQKIAKKYRGPREDWVQFLHNHKDEIIREARKLNPRLR